MAQGDIILFDQFIVDMAEKVHNLETDTLKVGLVNSTTTPATTTADPRWGAGGTTNFAANEVAPATGNYTAGGASITTGASATLTGGQLVFDSTDNPSWVQHASNPTNARWGILYNDTATGKNCIGSVDLGSVFNMTTGDLTITWNASGIITGNQV